VAWQKHGPEVLDYLGKRKPVELARLVAGCLPKELIFENVALDGQSPEELDAVILYDQAASAFETRRAPAHRRRNQ